MWFSVVCTLIDNDTRHHSGQNLLWTHEALLRVQTTLNHIRFVKWDVHSAQKGKLVLDCKFPRKPLCRSWFITFFQLQCIYV